MLAAPLFVACFACRQSIMRTIAPSGFLHSFEFNEIRATRAQTEFEDNGLGECSILFMYDMSALI